MRITLSSETRDESVVDRALILTLFGLFILLPISIAAVEISAAAACILSSALLIQRRSLPALPKALVLTLFLFFLSQALSLVWSEYPALTLKALFSKSGKCAVIFLIYAAFFFDPRRIRFFLIAAAAMTVFLLIDGTYQYFHRYDFVRHWPVTRGEFATSAYSKAAQFANFLIAFLPSFTVLIFSSLRKEVRAALACLCSLMIFFLLRIGSLGALIGLTAGMTLILFLYISQTRPKMIPVLIGGVVLALAGGFFLIPVFVSPLSWHERSEILNGVLRMIQAKPLFGHGLNTFARVYPSYALTKEVSGYYAHNGYLQIAAETGIAGLLAFLLWIGALMRFAAGSFCQTGPKTIQSLILLGFIGNVAAVLTHAATDNMLQSLQPSVLFWMQAGILTAAAGLNKTQLKGVEYAS